MNYKLPPQNCTIANSIVVGSVNQLFRLSADSESDTTCTYVGNVAWATDSASYGTRKNLTKLDPLLRVASFNGYNFSILSAGSPAINASIGSYVSEDVFGGARSGKPDVGANEHGGETPRQPLTVSNVGPNA